MQIPILIEPVARNGFRARGGEPFALSAEGATREEALGKLRGLMDQQMRKPTASMIGFLGGFAANVRQECYRINDGQVGIRIPEIVVIH